MKDTDERFWASDLCSDWINQKELRDAISDTVEKIRETERPLPKYLIIHEWKYLVVKEKPTEHEAMRLAIRVNERMDEKFGHPVDYPTECTDEMIEESMKYLTKMYSIFVPNVMEKTGKTEKIHLAEWIKARCG